MLPLEAKLILVTISTKIPTMESDGFWFSLGLGWGYSLGFSPFFSPTTSPLGFTKLAGFWKLFV
jgi:hypothetical protein